MMSKLVVLELWEIWEFGVGILKMETLTAP